MRSAKEESRTLTGVTPLEPERTGSVSFEGISTRVLIGRTTQKASGRLPSPRNSGARTTTAGRGFLPSPNPSAGPLAALRPVAS
jgi:hypothetical protein